MRYSILKPFYLLLILFLALSFFFSGCTTPPTSSINLTGNWTLTNSSSAGITTAKCYITDHSGSLTISNFYIIGQEYISWNTGYGTFQNFQISANISGSYKNIYGQTVSTIIYFEGAIDSSGISGTGTWLQTFNVVGLIESYSGTTLFVKG